MTGNNSSSDFRPSRRQFIAGATGLTFGFVLDPFTVGSKALAASAELSPNFWITIGADNIIKIVSPVAEMGQGTFTTMPLIVAEELDADWSKVSIIQPPVWDATKYGNPEYTGLLITSASYSVKGYFKTIRIAGAQARRVLVEAAATHWKVAASDLRTEPSVVVHPQSGRRLSYGEIAAFAKMPEKLPEFGEQDLKPFNASFRLIGKDVDRVDVPLKVRGAANYAIDVQTPGMVYATVLQPPYEGAAPATVDETKARQVAGVIDIVKLPGGVGVVAATVEAAFAAKRSLEVTWTEHPAMAIDSSELLTKFEAIAADKARVGVPFNEIGDAKAAIRDAKNVVSGSYRTQLLCHAQMEPVNATASVAADGKSVEVWAGTQSVSGLYFEVGKALGIAPAAIKFNQQYLGGGYGRRSHQEVVVEAVRLSKAVGKPVKVIWSREDDIAIGKYRPMTAHRIEAALDEQDRIFGWHHRIVSESVTKYFMASRGGTPPKNDHIVMKGSTIPYYGFRNRLSEHVVETHGVRLSALRGVGVGHNAFAIECFIDEVAIARARNPLAYRLMLTEGSPRMQNLLRTVAKMSDWERARTGAGLGVATMEKDETLGAAVAEVSVDRSTGKIKVHNVWAAVDIGIAIQPRHAAAISEGSIVFGLGHVLREKITIEKGRTMQSNFTDYQVMRMSDVPNIEVRIVSTPNRPTGVGEDGIPLIGPAVGNAVFAAAGIRLRELPMTPDLVLSALKARG